MACVCVLASGFCFLSLPPYVCHRKTEKEMRPTFTILLSGGQRERTISITPVCALFSVSCCQNNTRYSLQTLCSVDVRGSIAYRMCTGGRVAGGDMVLCYRLECQVSMTPLDSLVSRDPWRLFKECAALAPTFYFFHK